MKLSSFLHLLLHVIFLLYQANSFSIKMIPIDSSDLQILPKRFTIQERHHLFRDISLSRAFNGNRRNARLSLNSIHSNVTSIVSSCYVSQFTFGTIDPPFAPIVILDTSSNLTWIQCKECTQCFNLTHSFPVEESTSYHRLDPEDTRCNPKIKFRGSCGFQATYQTGSSQGYMGLDTVSFDNGYFPNVAFGCGISNTNFSFGDDTENVIAGVHGLGIGPKSFITQLDQEIKGRFTYCLRPDNESSSLIFGDEAKIIGDDARKVQIIAMNPDARYHLYLASIIVQGHRLFIDPSIFQLDDKDYTKGFFIDLGAPYTVLTKPAYAALKNATIDHFRQYNWDPVSPENNTSVFDLCYSEVPDDEKGQVYPSVALNFVRSPGDTSGEIKLLLDSKNVFGKSMAMEKGFCLKMLESPGPDNGPSIFGAYQQTNFQFLFDINLRMLSFVPKQC